MHHATTTTTTTTTSSSSSSSSSSSGGGGNGITLFSFSPHSVNSRRLRAGTAELHVKQSASIVG